MLEGLRQLIDLQRLDDELFAAESESEALPARRSALASEREAADARVAEARQTLDEAGTGQRSAEAELQDQEALLTRLEGQQFQIKNNEAYTALLHEMERAREAISGRETRILEAMDAIDRAKQELSNAEKRAEQVLARVSADEQAVDAREAELATRVAELRGSREVLIAQIDAELRFQYQKVAGRYRVAVTHVRQETCQGCRVNIPPQLQIELLRGERLITCPNCQRILILEDALQAAAK